MGADRIVGRRVTWRSRVGVLTVAWYERLPGRCGRLYAMVHLPLAVSRGR